MFVYTAFSHHYRGLVNIPRQVGWWEGSCGDTGEGHLLSYTSVPQPSLYSGTYRGFFNVYIRMSAKCITPHPVQLTLSWSYYDQQVRPGRVSDEHRTLLADLTAEPPGGGLGDVGQQDLLLSAPSCLK